MLEDVPDDLLILPKETSAEKSVYHTFVVQAHDRNNLQQYLKQNSIGTAIHYPVPIHLHPVAQDLGYKIGDFPKTESQSRKIISLPIYSSLEEESIEYVCHKIMEFYKK